MEAKHADAIAGMPKRLRELRLELGWTLDDVAQHLGFAQRGVASNWEATNQRRRIPELPTLLALQKWYGVSLDYLVGHPEAERDSPAVKAGKRVLREHLKALPNPETLSPRERAQLAATAATVVAPEAFFLDRLAAYFHMSTAEFTELNDNGFWSKRLIEQLADFVGIHKEWFYSPEPSRVLESVE